MVPHKGLQNLPEPDYALFRHALYKVGHCGERMRPELSLGVPPRPNFPGPNAVARTPVRKTV